MDLWDFFWIALWSAAVIGYLFAVVIILRDVFTDRELGGWAKAAWVLALIFVPLITMVVYLIARGDHLRERAAVEDYGERVIADDEVRVASATPAADIAHAKELLDRGAISAGEFDAMKSKALWNTF